MFTTPQPYRPTEDIILPLSDPLTTVSGQKITEIMVPKGTLVFLSLHQSNRDRELWGFDAAGWKPERWLKPLPSALVDAKIPGVYSNMYVAHDTYSRFLPFADISSVG